MIKVIIADDHELIRNGIKSTLENQKEIKIIGEAKNGKEALEITEQLNPDVLVLDVSMPIKNGFEVAEQIIEKPNSPKVLFLTMYDDYEFINKCLDISGSGYLVKTDVGGELSDAIIAVYNGQKYYSNTVQKVIVHNYSMTKSHSKKETVKLTNREKEVVNLLAKGMTSADIAESLFVSPRTIDTHRANLMRKLEVKNSVELINKLTSLNLL